MGSEGSRDGGLKGGPDRVQNHKRSRWGPDRGPRFAPTYEYRIAFDEGESNKLSIYKCMFVIILFKRITAKIL